MNISSKPKPCFILGIDQRSGTNFLFQLLSKHPNCLGPGPIWEDKFLKHSEHLIDYTHNLFQSWNPRWEVETKIGNQETLLNYFGNAIELFLRLQLSENNTGSTKEQINKSENKPPEILLTKTPTVEGLDNFYQLFPDAYLILLIRDGRAVVESGVKSFGWDYESAIQRWAARADIILNFRNKLENTYKKYLLLKYEDIIQDEERELRKIFDFLNIDPDVYDYQSAQSLGVTGSSELKKQSGEIHWQEIKKKRDFNPIDRFKDWDQTRHERFNWIAGKQMEELGYTTNQVRGNKQLLRVRNNFKSLLENTKSLLRRARSNIQDLTRSHTH